MSSPYCESADTLETERSFKCQYTQMQFGSAWSGLKYVDGEKRRAWRVSKVALIKFFNFFCRLCPARH